MADIFNIARQQVNEYMRDKDEIRVKARQSKYKRMLGSSQKGALFPAAEATVMDQFKDSRKKGRQVGPKWLKMAMKREVRKIVEDPTESIFSDGG